MGCDLCARLSVSEGAVMEREGASEGEGESSGFILESLLCCFPSIVHWMSALLHARRTLVWMCTYVCAVMVKPFVSNVRRGFLGRLRASSRAKDIGGINLWDCWDAALWLMFVDKMDDA